MNALERYAKKHRCTIPTRGSAAYKIIEALFCGQKLTARITDARFNLMALSQTIGRMKKDNHWPIKTELIKTSSGKTIARYWMEK